MQTVDRFIEFIIDCIQIFQFWVVIDEYERGVLLRFGKFNRVLEPGIHWVIPFYIDKAIHDNVVTRTTELPPQTLTTRDNRTVSVTAVVTSNIRYIKKALLEVEGVDHALVDSCAAAVGSHVSSLTWDELRAKDITEALTKLCRENAWRYGIEIERVQLADLALSRVIRLHTTKPIAAA
jgi:regulator of protease activity HflC (stomatin/prohibitin superfamily)